MNIQWDKIKDLPITEHLNDICEKLKNSPSRFLVLTASTGAGKSTAIPLALLKNFEGQILMLEPRRLAVVNIASRVSELLGESLGKTCGYIMHLEKKISCETRFTVLTEAILTRKIQKDPDLAGVSVVVIDEFHERSIHGDLALAFLKEAMQLRDDLFVIVMSATIETEKLCSYLAGTDSSGKTVPCPLYSVPGRLFPVDIEYRDKCSVSETIMNELSKEDDDGSILVFLPGIMEIRKVEKELHDLGCRAEILLLHSSVSFSEQKKVLSVPKSVSLERSQRRVILSSAIAETSLTVPDVTLVIDSGLARISSFNRQAGMQTLITQNESLFNADQRAGRAGRVREGKCIRLWNKNDIRPKSSPPEILRSDLSSLVLECAEWGGTKRDSISFLDEIPESSWDSSCNLLKLLGCLKDDSITDLGRAVLSMGTSVRLACVALSGLPYGKSKFSTGIAVACDDSIKGDSFLIEKYKSNLENRVQKADKIYKFSSIYPQEYTDFSTECALLAGYPDRIAMLLKDCDEGTYVFPSGRLASLPKSEARPYPRFLIAINVDAGDRSGKIFNWHIADENIAVNFLMQRSCKVEEVFFDKGKIRKKEKVCYGKIILKESYVPVSSEDYIKALANEVSKNGLDVLPLSEASKNLILRCQFYVEHCSGSELLIEKLNNLNKNIEDWLSPFLVGDTKPDKQNVFDALYFWLSGGEVDKSVPNEIKLPNGRKVKLVYEKQNGQIIPVMEVIIQRIFGCFKTPEVLGVPLLLRLLSPAGRPLQVTRDLENFWKETWPEICTEMKGRYPKHNWDYKIISS